MQTFSTRFAPAPRQVGDGKPEPAAARLRREERLEDLLSKTHRNAGSVVAHFDRPHSVTEGCLDADVSLSVHRLRRIEQQVQYRRPNQVRVDGDLACGPRDLNVER